MWITNVRLYNLLSLSFPSSILIEAGDQGINIILFQNVTEITLVHQNIWIQLNLARYHVMDIHFTVYTKQ